MLQLYQETKVRPVIDRAFEFLEAKIALFTWLKEVKWARHLSKSHDSNALAVS